MISAVVFPFSFWTLSQSMFTVLYSSCYSPAAFLLSLWNSSPSHYPITVPLCSQMQMPSQNLQQNNLVQLQRFLQHVLPSTGQSEGFVHPGSNQYSKGPALVCEADSVSEQPPRCSRGADAALRRRSRPGPEHRRELGHEDSDRGTQGAGTQGSVSGGWWHRGGTLCPSYTCSHGQSIPSAAQEPVDTTGQGMTECVWGHNIYPAPQ